MNSRGGKKKNQFIRVFGNHGGGVVAEKKYIYGFKQFSKIFPDIINRFVVSVR